MYNSSPAGTKSIFLCTIFTIAFASLMASLPLYAIYLEGSEECQVNYILSNDTTQCGYGNSLQYRDADIKGCPLNGDELTATLNVWQIRYNELILYSQALPPVNSNGQTAYHSTFLLMEQQLYMWKDSVIAGFCCIANNNEEDKTASLHVFHIVEDVYRFELGDSVTNAVFSERIHLQPKKTSCFQKWGTNSPFTVTHSSYYFIGIDLPENMNYTANITVMQTYVNVSDYPNSKPKHFRRDNHTSFSYPDKWFHQTDYLYICEAPSVYLEESEPDSVSLHVCTCNNSDSLMNSIFMAIFWCGLLGVLGACTFCLILYIKQHLCLTPSFDTVHA